MDALVNCVMNYRSKYLTILSPRGPRESPDGTGPRLHGPGASPRSGDIRLLGGDLLGGEPRRQGPSLRGGDLSIPPRGGPRGGPSGPLLHGPSSCLGGERLRPLKYYQKCFLYRYSLLV